MVLILDNPLDTPVTIHNFRVHASIRGARIVYVEHGVLDSFTVPVGFFTLVALTLTRRLTQTRVKNARQPLLFQMHILC